MAKTAESVNYLVEMDSVPWHEASLQMGRGDDIRSARICTTSDCWWLVHFDIRKSTRTIWH